LYAGLFAATFGAFAHREVACVEVGCAAKGDGHCTFAIAAEARAKAAEAERDQGARADDILERITA
jgi:hypothetical protein